MILSIIILLITTIVALNGVLYEPRKDPDKPISWRNINLMGKILILILICLFVLSAIREIIDGRSHLKELKSRDEKIDLLLHTQAELVKTNNHLIKVMSVADGYNALITGVIVFRDRPGDENKIRDVLQNILLKYVEIKFRAVNELGVYHGRIDYATHPEVRKFLHLSEGIETEYFSRYEEYYSRLSYFFEIRCTNVKILSNEKVQYAKMSENDLFDINVNKFSWDRDFYRIYDIMFVKLDKLTIEELGEYPLNSELGFLR